MHCFFPRECWGIQKERKREKKKKKNRREYSLWLEDLMTLHTISYHVERNIFHNPGETLTVGATLALNNFLLWINFIRIFSNNSNYTWKWGRKQQDTNRSHSVTWENYFLALKWDPEFSVIPNCKEIYNCERPILNGL